MIAGLLVMLLVGFVMGVIVTQILVGQTARREADENYRLAQKAAATAYNWEKVADKAMRESYVHLGTPYLDREDLDDNDDHSKSAELRVVTP